MNPSHLPWRSLAAICTLGLLLLAPSVFAQQADELNEELTVGISPELNSFSGIIDGKPVVIRRNQDPGNMVSSTFARTSRPCPPFCIQPMHLATGVETIGELELINYLKQMANGDQKLLLIDSRTPDWVSSGSIPGAINIPWTSLNPVMGSDPLTISEILSEQFGAAEMEGLWDFSQAKTLIFFCNGPWCGQSPNNIRNLLKFGYPAERIKWYRGGMQAWESLGFETTEID